jgi:hypothetical protein
MVAPRCRRTEGQREEQEESGGQRLGQLMFHVTGARYVGTADDHRQTAVVHQLSAERIRSTYSFS